MNNTARSLSEIAKSNEFSTWCNLAMQDVFESLFAVTDSITPIKSDKSEDLEISGVVAFVKDDIEALLQLSCSKETMSNLVKATSSDSTPMDQNILCIGEAVNIIFGILKENMNSYDHHYEKCLPLVIVGHNHVILNLNRSDVFRMAYRSPFGNFNLKVGVGNKAKFRSAS